MGEKQGLTKNVEILVYRGRGIWILAGGEVFEGYSIPCIGLELERDVFSRYNGWNSKGLLLLSNVSNDLRRRVIDMQLYSNVVVVWSP